MVEIWRGDILECIHNGHAAVCDGSGQIVHAWGNPDAAILPRSSCKMIQALPLVESGAADAANLTSEQLALSCSSHTGALIHTDRVSAWLDALGFSDDDLRCGAHPPSQTKEKLALIRANKTPCQIHNNCSGKHTGFLTLAKHLKSGPEYLEISHPVQQASRAALEETTGLDSPSFAIDGCSAPNFETTVSGLARAMAFFATAKDGAGLRQTAAHRLFSAMTTHPDLVAGEGKACTELMRATNGRVALKTGAEGVYVAIIPELGMGVALKISDGATRASECAVAAILVKLGVLDENHPAAIKRISPLQKNWRGLETGIIRPAIALLN
jgi:L-asparaginase II